MSTGDERKLATLLFADLVGSTALADGEDPERVRMRLERFYDAMSEEIERTGGTVEKFAGDAVLAAFGVPVAVEDHAERALHTALSLRSRLAELHEGLSLRIGVNTGEVVVGRVREGSSFVSGDAVNVSARLEQAAAPGEILAGERTVAAAAGAFEFGPLREVDAKGKTEPLTARPLLRALSLARPRGSELQPVFVGREPELELLTATYRRAVTAREPHLVTIVGEPGVGKTTLVRELWAALADPDGPVPPVRRTGRCLPYGDGITYWPLGEVLKEQFGILESDTPQDAMEKLAGREILGLALGLDVAGDLHPLDARERLHASAVELVEELAATQPLVAVVEDLHWAEADFLDLLERVVQEARAPLVLVATARPELFGQRPMWGAARRNAATIWLEPLAPDTTTVMLSRLLDAELPEELRDLIVERAGGNPFFVEELVSALVEAGALERSNGGWKIHEVSGGLAVPDSVHAALAARMDRLPPTEKAALQAASVVGRTFWRGPVLELLDGEAADFGLLEERDFVRRRAESSLAGETEYTIKHALTRDVAYSSIPKSRRGRLHAAFARWMVVHDRAKDEHASLLAYHFAEAVRREDADLVWGDEPAERDLLRTEAVRWLERAAALARSRYEMEEVVRLLTTATELTDDDHERALLWREIGHAQALRYDGDAFWGAMSRSLEGPLDDGERAEVYSQLAFQTSIRSGMWTTRPAQARVAEWVERALELSEAGSDAEVRALLARAEIDPGGVPDDLVAGIATIAEAHHDRELRSFALGALCHAAFERRRFEEAARWAATRLALAPAMEDPDGLCEIYEDGVPIAATMGDREEAQRLAALHLGVASRLSPHHRLHSLSLRLEVAEAVGDWRGIVAQEDEVAAAIAENLATPCIRNARDLLLCALARLCSGDESRSSELELEARSLSGEGHERELAPVLLRMALVRGDRTGTLDLAQVPFLRTWVWGPGLFGTLLDALAALRDRDRVELEAASLVQAGTITEPFALRALGIVRGDDALLERADEGFAAAGLEWHRAQTERLLVGF